MRQRGGEPGEGPGIGPRDEKQGRREEGSKRCLRQNTEPRERKNTHNLSVFLVGADARQITRSSLSTQKMIMNHREAQHVPVAISNCPHLRALGLLSAVQCN